MKKYKLIKEYPGSPKLGVTADKKDVCDFWYINDGFNNIGKNIDQFPEFWEEVVEKDYEILSLIEKGGFTGWYFDKENNGWTVDEPDRMYHKEIPSWCKIYSVKRLSDGEVFTVGDNIWRKEWSTAAHPPISAIKINHEGKIIIHTLHSVSYLPQIMKKVKKLLFTTEDGVDIFEGDKYYRNSGWHFESCGFIHTATKDTKFFMSHKPFSTKEKAEEYILMNKPCLSLNDVESVLDKLRKYQYHHTTLNKLIELVKSRL
jgi:hypothetical protein